MLWCLADLRYVTICSAAKTFQSKTRESVHSQERKELEPHPLSFSLVCCAAACSTSFSRPQASPSAKLTTTLCYYCSHHHSHCFAHFRGSHHQIIARSAEPRIIVQHRPVPFDICNKVTLTSLFGGPPLLLPRYCTSCPATLSLPFHFCPFTSHSVSLGIL